MPHRALLFLLVALLTAPLPAQPGKGPSLPQDRAAHGGADQAEGARILAEFRQAGIAGDYWLSFELRVMPRRGEERTVRGAMLGTRNAFGPVTRLALAGESWLIESGPTPAAWRQAGGQTAGVAATAALAGTGVTVFDLQMPFLYWRDFLYEGRAIVRGRPAHSFILRPPAGDAQAAPPGLTGVRVLLDVEFQALVQAEELGENNAVRKTLSLLELKKVGEQWLVKSIDVRDARTRDKTRFTVTAAALGLHWPERLFAPEALAAPLPGPPEGSIVRF